jgi:ABC-type multidrug transport system ATPase subunit
MRRFAHTLEATVVASLLQPEPAVVALFDEVLLMSEGRVIWHGPADKVSAARDSGGAVPGEIPKAAGARASPGLRARGRLVG